VQPTNYSSHTSLESVISSLYNDTASEHTIERNQCIAHAANECESAMELGVFQGSCLALIYTNLKHPKELYGIDTHTKPFLNGGLKPLFDEYSKRCGSTYEIIETSSVEKESVRSVDFLHIDSLHRPAHLAKELALHSPNIRKYIAFHDINQNNSSLGTVVKDFVKHNKEWEMAKYYDKGKCGHALIRRV